VAEGILDVLREMAAGYALRGRAGRAPAGGELALRPTMVVYLQAGDTIEVMLRTRRGCSSQISVFARLFEQFLGGRGGDLTVVTKNEHSCPSRNPARWAVRWRADRIDGARG